MPRERFAAGIEGRIEQFHQAFDRRADLMATVLRGHMMIEERLHDVISAGVADYTRPITKNDIFSFGTAAKIAQAIVGSADRPDFWKGIISWNSLRNALGHRVQPARLDSLLTSFFKDTESTAFRIFTTNSNTYQHKGESEETHALVVRLRCMAFWTILGIHADNLAKDLDEALISRRSK